MFSTRYYEYIPLLKRIKNIALRTIFLASITYITIDIVRDNINPAILEQIYFKISTLNTNSDLREFDFKPSSPDEEAKFNYLKKIVADREILYYIFTYSYQYKIDPLLFSSLIKYESNFNPNATNNNRNGSIDRGLCQLNNFSFKELSIRDFYEPRINLENGAKYLKWCLDMSQNNIVVALAFYNSGIGSVNSRNVGKSTLTYIEKILEFKRDAETKIASRQDKRIILTLNNLNKSR